MDGDLRGMAILPNGLVATMLGARADAEVIKVRRKATVFMVLKSLLRSAVAEWGEARGQGVRRDGGARGVRGCVRVLATVAWCECAVRVVRGLFG